MKYQLVLRIPFEAMDDIQARQMAQTLLNSHAMSSSTVIKLQRLNENSEPIGIKVDPNDKNTPVAQPG